MQGATTTITDPNASEPPKKFTFDYSYWSHDGCKEESNGFFGPDTSHPNGRKFADQSKVFDDLGLGVLNNAWEGYNSTLFAYGQTGSGKSWSMVGYGINKGIVPLLCDKMFQQIDEKRAAGTDIEFEITFSMLEIYNEQVRDLLDSGSKKGGLRVRQHPKQGFYADGLKIVPVGSYVDIEKKMDAGTTNRTVAATQMNATSSRAHTIVGITFIQKFTNAAGEATSKTAVINLVDLAGSERAESTGATGDRLKEGAAINQSLSCLGNCIAALAEKSSGKDTRVPYRDSVLTKLLKNALGGNSKTIMIAALSPADINYDETLSTLRYADRAKQIKTSAKVNEDPTEKLIRELQEENEKLKEMLQSGNIQRIQTDGDDDMTEAEKSQMNKELEEEYKSVVLRNQQEMEEMKRGFEERLMEAQQSTGGTDTAAVNEKKKTIPHIFNLNMDVQLTGHIVHFLDSPEKVVGSGKAEGVEIILPGPSVSDKHAIFREEAGVFSIEPCAANLRLMRNGKSVTNKTVLKHNDRLIFGTTQYFVFANPKERDASKETYPEITFEMAQEEKARRSGFDVSGENKSRDDALLQEDMLELMPAVEEANSISEELDKKLKFELMIVSPEARGELKGRTEVMVRVQNLETKHEWIWPRQKFVNRKYIMQEMYQNYLEGEEWNLPAEKDPFDEDYSADFHIGSVKLWLQSLSFQIESKEQLEITDYKGQEVGVINVEAIPCDGKGKEYTEADDIFVESPEDLVNKDINFKIKITSARGLPSKFTDVYSKFCVFLEEEYTSTSVIKNTSNPDWNFSKMWSYPKATQQLVDYLHESAIMVQVWGKQKPPKSKKAVNTKAAMMQSASQKGLVSAANTNAKRFDAEKVKYMMECSILRKRQERMEQKLHAMKKMLEVAEQHKKKRLSLKLIHDIYHAPTADAAEKCMLLIPQEKDEDTDDEDDIIKEKPVMPRKKSSSSSSSSSDEEDKKETVDGKINNTQPTKLSSTVPPPPIRSQSPPAQRPTPTPRQTKKYPTVYDQSMTKSKKGSSSCVML
ncbi:hypothetical protein ScPMuIL_013190 [Solemya velum]